MKAEDWPRRPITLPLKSPPVFHDTAQVAHCSQRINPVVVVVIVDNALVEVSFFAARNPASLYLA